MVSINCEPMHGIPSSRAAALVPDAKMQYYLYSRYSSTLIANAFQSVIGISFCTIKQGYYYPARMHKG